MQKLKSSQIVIWKIDYKQRSINDNVAIQIGERVDYCILEGRESEMDVSEGASVSGRGRGVMGLVTCVGGRGRSAREVCPALLALVGTQRPQSKKG